jgi:mannose-6-phosphate isomerase
MINAQIPLYPLVFAPVYKDYLWGGAKIRTLFGRQKAPDVCAESWEISGHRDGPGLVRNGALSGHSLSELVDAYGAALVGTRAPGGSFPLLIKILDARDVLSVQVHPNDATAAAHGGEPKTEAWVVLQADEGAAVYAGLAEGTDEARFVAAAQTPSMADCMVRHEVTAGDIIFVPGGRVHAIGAGCLMFEVQQASNTTYRIHDWGRTDAQGRPRELHLEQALRVIDWEDRTSAQRVSRRVEAGTWGHRSLLCESPYFRIEQLVLSDAWPLPPDPGTFQAYFMSKGDAYLHGSHAKLDLPFGSSVLVPASLSELSLAPMSGAVECLRVTLPGK